ncbi:molybdopterin cofactor-binding domain-containing protein [Gluconacetobacter sp. Hr-1-5]|uniref:xanthine dehydrogenase family protein molybdopterin-binding subunit n=1 Tax=Gluconacetobacter sp. Hr-1-5 TaxID=3395370 RepID=UPI003B526604
MSGTDVRAVGDGAACVSGGVSRRRFLAGAGLLLAYAASGPGRARADVPAAPAWHGLGGFVRIGTDDSIALIVPNIEMGQGIFTAEAMLIAEELEVPLDRIAVLTASPQDFASVPPTLLKTLSTGGSRSVRSAWLPLRQAGAAARLMLLGAAAERWGVGRELLVAEGGVVRDPTGRHRATYGELAEAAVGQSVPDPVPLKPREAWTLLGRPMPRTDIPAKTTGRAVFGIDVRLPGMAYGAVSACPVIGGTVARLDDRAARAIPGVVDVVSIGTAVAVIARAYWTARRGLAALEIVWDEGAHATLSSADVMTALRDAHTHVPPVMARDADGIDALLADPARRIEAAYELPFLAHAAMEPINTTIHVQADRCDVWVGTQVPTRARLAVAKQTGLPVEKIAIHNQMIGGGFGRRLATDSIEQAAALARHLPYPVQFIWSREEDIQHDLFRPAYYDRMTATLGADGLPSAWVHHVSGGSVADRFAPGGLPHGKLDKDAVAGAADTPYGFSKMRVLWTRADSPVPISWWRGVGPAHNVYVVECFLDEVAAAAGADPVAYRRRLLAHNPRSLAVLDRVARESGWGQALPAGSGRGVALHNAFGSFCAVVAEISVRADGTIRIARVTVALDCGFVINPDIIRAQIEGGLLFGFSAALNGEITFREGRVQQSNFHDYPQMRINEAPAVDIHILDSTEAPGGIGEVGTVSAFPALGNALFAATGRRWRRYPFRDARKTA